MGKYKVGDKIVMVIADEIGATLVNKGYIDNAAKPLYAYTEPLEAKIRRQETEITKLLAENEKLKKYLEYYHTGTGICDIESARITGQNEAWELARKITCQPINGGFNRSEFEEMFGDSYISDIFKKYTYTEAATKVEEWENKKEEIKDGDVLEGIYDNNLKCIVTNLYTDNIAYLVFDDGTAGFHELDNFKKTGRHIDIDSFLKQIGGEQK